MTSLFPVIINGVNAPAFYPTLDGLPYNCSVTFNVASQRYYLNCFASDATLVFSVPIVETLTGYTITSLQWDQQQLWVAGVISGSFRLMGAKPGTILNWTLENMTPSSFNGAQSVLVTSDTTFTYRQTSDPGMPQIYGALTPYINIAKGYFTSTIIFRNNTFEVSP